MGKDTGGSNERPEHTVYLDAFWIDKTEVTNKMYALCVSDGKCQEPANISSSTRSAYFGNSEFDDYPVIYVDWNMAKTYCEWADRRLPTEAEWEKAARGDDARNFPWGNNPPHDNLLNFNSHVGDTTKVGSYLDGASPYGALDMAGNVWEWVADRYRDYYYVSSPASNPSGPASGVYRVLRGGSWFLYRRPTSYGSVITSGGGGFYSWNRTGDSPTSNNYYFGFRCAMSASP